MSDLYVNKNPEKPNGGEWVDIYEVYAPYEGTHKKIGFIYKGNKKIWELIVGFIFTHDEYSLKTKDDYIIKCKDQ